ncbi:MAG: hypothetical protein Q7U38_19210 [Methylobacter sp.]|nr:hypothetical protein [Methylobacter sp.]MDP2100087.1 hypothetical protein [Methylobacter sp.]MDP2427702.1 hypothetical protein [Methylobacter sp.]MDP3055098.1 hypothetical protein [Methylobacter sp.]MDP3360953.1 hypothetical protein [Methylobacter sp.]
MTDDELKALVASLAVAQDRTDEQMKATDEKIASLAVAQQETTRKLDKLGELYGNVGQNQGDVMWRKNSF